MRIVSRIQPAAMTALVLVALASTASATTWCGQNGLVKLSFTAGEELNPVLNVQPGENGMTAVDLYAVLDEVDDVANNGERFLAVGGFEMRLVVEGAEPIFQEEEFPYPHFNVGQRPGQCQVGMKKGQSLVDGRLVLARWHLLFPSPPKNVVFRLDPGGLPSARTIPGCAESEPQFLYVGTPASQQVGMMFGAGYVPAYLNWEGEPDLTPVTGINSWREVGIFTAPAKEGPQTKPKDPATGGIDAKPEVEGKSPTRAQK